MPPRLPPPGAKGRSACYLGQMRALADEGSMPSSGLRPLRRGLRPHAGEGSALFDEGSCSTRARALVGARWWTIGNRVLLLHRLLHSRTESSASLGSVCCSSRHKRRGKAAACTAALERAGSARRNHHFLPHCTLCQLSPSQLRQAVMLSAAAMSLDETPAGTEVDRYRGGAAFSCGAVTGV